MFPSYVSANIAHNLYWLPSFNIKIDKSTLPVLIRPCIVLYLIIMIILWMPQPLQANTFDVLPRRKRITMFKTAGGWIFKHFFDDSAIFKELADHYNKDLFRFEFKTVGERNKALKLLELRGFDVELVEDLRGYAVKLPRYSKYAPVLKNSVAMIETPEWRIFLMKDLAAVEEAERSRNEG